MTTTTRPRTTVGEGSTTTMGLAARLAGGPPPRKDLRCAVGRLIVSLDEDEADALRSALDDESWQGVEIAKVLAEEGHDIAYYSVNRHRRGLCKCNEQGAA